MRQEVGGVAPWERHQYVVMQRRDDLAGGVIDDRPAHREGLLNGGENGFVGDGIDGFLGTVHCDHGVPAPCCRERQRFLALGNDSSGFQGLL
ncbi:hypothetical protein D3C73_1529210 [compost metagenome]